MKRVLIISIVFLWQALTPLAAQSWKSLTENNSGLPSNAINFIYFDDDQSIWFCTQDSGLVHYQNGLFSSFNSTSNDGFDANYVNRIVKSPAGVYWIATEYHGLYKWVNGQFTHYENDGAGHELQYLRSLILENGGPANGGALWIGTWSHGLFRFDGNSWSYFDQTSGVLPDNSTLALCAEDDPNSNKSIIWVGTNNGLMKYDGTNWENVAIDGQTNLWINAIDLKNGGPSFTGGELVVGCESGQLALYDGTNWEIFNMADAWNPDNSVTSISVDRDGIVWFGQYSEGLGRYDTKSLLSFYKDNSGIMGNQVLTVATRVKGDSTEVWSSIYENGYYLGLSIYTEKRITGLAQQSELPTTFSLEQNFPNPFNPVTQIRFTLNKAGQTWLTVFNALGQRVRTLVNRKMAAGVHQVHFNAVDLPSGLYFYTLQSGDRHLTRKMLLVR